MPVPREFTPGAVAASREGAFTPYKKAMQANNSLNSTFLQNNPWLRTPCPGEQLSFGDFYDEDSDFAGYPKKYYDKLPLSCHPYYRGCLICAPPRTRSSYATICTTGDSA